MALNYDRLSTLELAPIEQSYDERSTILYALGIGLGSDPLDARQLRFVYEKGLEAFPTMAATLGYPGLFLRDPSFGVDWTRIVHGEQSLRIHQPLAPSGRVVSTNRVESVVDLGPGRHALVYVSRETRDAASNELISTQSITTVCRGEGGFGGPPKPNKTAPELTVYGPPDAVITLPTMPQAALLYRLCGDLNPLHIDPAVAATAGFDRPILHGLCTFGVAAHAVLRSQCAYDARRLKCVEARFVAPVWPGELIETEIWRLGNGRLAFRCRVAARNRIVIDHGYCEHEVVES